MTAHLLATTAKESLRSYLTPLSLQGRIVRRRLDNTIPHIAHLNGPRR
jgi:hypothetical protein